MKQLAIVMGVGIDKVPGTDEIEVTVQIVKPGATFVGQEGGGLGGSETKPVWVASARGRTISEAQRRLNLKSSREIYWAHCIFLVLGEELARQGVDDVLDFFLRGPQPREFMWIMVARGTAKQILTAEPELEKIPAQAIGFLTRSKAGHAVMLKDFVKQVVTPGTGATASLLELTTAIEGEDQEDGQKPKEVKMVGGAVFRQAKLVGFLDETETRGLMWLRGEVVRGVVTIPSPEKKEGRISINIYRSRTKVIPEIHDGMLKIKVEIDTEGDLAEEQGPDDASQPAVIEEINQYMASQIEERCHLALQKAQTDLQTDVFGFGEAVHRRYPQEWKLLKNRWEDEFPKVPVEVTVNAQIRRTGLMTKPIFKKIQSLKS